MRMEPKVSIIIPTHNRKEMLLEAVRSVRQQTFADFELIIVDDGSDDGTDAVLADLKADSRIRYFWQDHAGVASARNHGIKESRAHWIVFLDSDDLWLPDKLSKQWDYVQQNPGVKICQTEEIWMRHGVRVNSGLRHKKHSGWIFSQCLPLCIVSPSAVMIERSVFTTCGTFDEALPACEDYDLWLRVALKYQIITMSEPLVIKRGGHEDQLSQKFWGMDRFRIVALQKILRHPDLDCDSRKLVEESIRFRYGILHQGLQKRGKKCVPLNVQSSN